VTKVFTLFIVSILLLSIPGHALSVTAAHNQAPVRAASNILYAASCSQADVQAAIDAASDGDGVSIPPGTCNWSSSVTVPPAKGLIIQGAGIDQTIILNGIFWINTGRGKFYRLSGLTLNAAGWTIFVCGSSNRWRIDHNKIAGTGEIWVDGIGLYGVIDHNTFNGDPRSTIRIFQGSYDSRGNDFPFDGGATSWRTPSSIGTADAVYVEDNTWDFPTPVDGISALDGRSGARWVLRHNTLLNVQWGSHDAEIGHERGTRQFEAYQNTFIYTQDFNMSLFHRGGTGVIWGNRFRATNFTWANTPFILRNTRSAEGDVIGEPWSTQACNGGPQKFCLGGPPHACNTDADCSGDFKSPCVPIDGNQETNGYACRDQIGRSTDDPITGAQALEPLYLWDNYYCYGPNGNCNPEPPPAGSGQIPQVYVSTGSQHIQKDRDYFESVSRLAYTPYIYPHPLTKELVLSGTPTDQLIRLNWEVRTILFPPSSWRISYDTQTIATPFSITLPLSSTRAYSLTNLTNYVWYTVTLNAMLDSTPILTDSIRLMPTDRLVYLPLILR
jgi:hypothetical protein